MCKWMHWSLADLYMASGDHIREIIQAMHEEAEALREARGEEPSQEM